MTKKQLYIILSGIAIVILLGFLPDNGTRPNMLVQKDKEDVYNLTLKIQNVVQASAENQTSLSQGFNILNSQTENSTSDIEKRLIAQTQIHFKDAGIPLKIKSAPEFMLYSYKDGEEVKWIIWLDKNFTDASDLTANFPAEGSMVLTERFLSYTETEPLVRGYLIEDGVAKIVVSTTPVFVEVEK